MMFGNHDFTKVMYGQNAIHIPAWMVIQNQEEGGVIIAGASKSTKPMYGSGKTHVLILGEIIIRPHYAVGSNDFEGQGAAGFWTNLPGAGEWLKNGDILVHTNSGYDALRRWD